MNQNAVLQQLLADTAPAVKASVTQAFSLIGRGDTGPAVTVLRECLKDAPAGQDGHRLVLASIVSVIAASRLGDGPPAELLVREYPAGKNVSSIRRSTVEMATRWLADAARRAIQAGTTCPNCGSAASSVVGNATLSGGAAMTDIATAGILFDIRALQAAMPQDPPVTVRGWGTIASRLVQSMSLTAPARQCEECGLLYLQWPMDRERVAQYYVDFAEPSSTLQGTEVTGQSENLRATYVKAKFPEFVRKLLGDLSGRRVLDLGCGEGTMLACLREYGAKPIGFDLDVKRARYAALALGLPDMTFEAERFHALPDSVVDVVVSFHALEHIPEVDRTLANVARILRPGGRVAFAVPRAIPSDGKVLGMGGDHLIGFTPLCLKNFFERQGITVNLLAAGPDQNPMHADPSGHARWSGMKDDMILVGTKSAS